MKLPGRVELADALAAPRARVAGWLEELQPRERRLVVAAAAATLAIVAWLAVVEPIGDAIARLDRGLASARRDAATIGDLVARYKLLRAEVATLDRDAGPAAGEPSLFARLESIAVPIVGREHVAAMNPSSRSAGDALTEESVELRLEGVPMRALVGLLYAIEHRDPPLQLARVSFRRQYKSPELVDATLVVARVRAK